MSKVIHMKAKPTKVENPSGKAVNIKTYASKEAMAAFKALSDHLV